MHNDFLFLMYPSLSRATHILYIYVFILKNHIPRGFEVKSCQKSLMADEDMTFFKICMTSQTFQVILSSSSFWKPEHNAASESFRVQLRVLHRQVRNIIDINIEDK